MRWCKIGEAMVSLFQHHVSGFHSPCACKQCHRRIIGNRSSYSLMAISRSLWPCGHGDKKWCMFIHTGSHGADFVLLTHGQLCSYSYYPNHLSSCCAGLKSKTEFMTSTIDIETGPTEMVILRGDDAIGRRVPDLPSWDDECGGGFLEAKARVGCFGNG